MDIQTGTALTTGAVAVLVAVITWRQWVTNRARLKHELFDRRFTIYEKITSFLGEMLQGPLPIGRDAQFLRETKQAFFVFNCDPKVKSLISEVYSHAVDLHAAEAELDGLTGAERTANIRKQRELKDWILSTLSSVEVLLAKYLRLEH